MDILHIRTDVRLFYKKKTYDASVGSDPLYTRIHRLVVRIAAFQAVDMGSNPVECN